MARILFVIESLFPLGPAGQLIPLARQLAIRNHEIHIGVLDLRDDEGAAEAANVDADLGSQHRPVCETLLTAGITVHSLGQQPVSHPFSRDSFQAIWRLRNLCGRVKPDILHAWCGMAEFATLAATQFLPASLGGQKLRRFLTELMLQPEKRFTRQAYENHFSHGFEKVVVPHEVAKQHRVANGDDASRIVIVPNAIADLSQSDLERTQHRAALLEKLGLPPSVKIAGTVAPLIPRTHLKDLIWACDQLACVRDDFHFVIIGKGSQRKRLERFSKLTRGHPFNHFLGEPDCAEQLLAGLDFYWHSHLVEPLPTNLMTAMSRGVPVISVYGPGTRELIRHQETGFAVNFGARDEFARWSRYLIDLEPQAQQLAEQGQTFVQQNFSFASLLDRYLDLYS